MNSLMFTYIEEKVFCYAKVTAIYQVCSKFIIFSNLIRLKFYNYFIIYFLNNYCS